MWNTLPLLVAGGSLALLPLLGPTTRAVAGGMERVSVCRVQSPGPMATTRDWLGSLHGWQDSALVFAWRGSLAAAKGRPPPSACASVERLSPIRE